MLNGQKPNIKVGGDFTTLPADKYTCQIADVSLSRQLNFQKTAEEDVLKYKLVVLDEKTIESTEGEQESTRGRFLFKNCTMSVSNRSWLGKLANSAIGHEMDQEEMKKFASDPESIVGKQVDVLVEQKEGTGKNAGRTFANIVSFSKASRPLSPMSDEEIAKVEPVVEKTSTPVVAPKANDPETFIAQTKKEGAEEIGEEVDEVANAQKLLDEAKLRAKKKAKVLTA